MPRSIPLWNRRIHFDLDDGWRRVRRQYAGVMHEQVRPRSPVPRCISRLAGSFALFVATVLGGAWELRALQAQA
ncbi:MAG: hypothetical protein ACYCT1_20380 [Steroidobacteraceae bacterium]